MSNVKVTSDGELVTVKNAENWIVGTGEGTGPFPGQPSTLSVFEGETLRAEFLRWSSVELVEHEGEGGQTPRPAHRWLQAELDAATAERDRLFHSQAGLAMETEKGDEAGAVRDFLSNSQQEAEHKMDMYLSLLAKLET